MSLSERLVILIDSKVDGAVRGLNEVSDSTDKLGRKVGVFDRAADALNGKLGKLGISANVTGQALTGVAAGLGAAAFTGAVAGATQAVRAFQSLAAEVLRIKRVTGATAEDASGLVQLLGDFEVAADAASAPLGRLARTLGTAPDALRQYGVAAARTSTGAVDLVGTLANVADAYNRTTDPARRAALGSAAFGRAYQDLIPVLEQGGDAIRRAAENRRDGLILDDDDLRSAEDLRIALDDLGDSVQALSVSIGSELVPQVTSAVKSFTGFVDAVSRVNDALPRGFDFGRLFDLGAASSSLGGALQLSTSARQAFAALSDEQERGTQVGPRLGVALRNVTAAVKGLASDAREAAVAVNDLTGRAAIGRVGSLNAATAAQDRLNAAVGTQQRALRDLERARVSAGDRAVSAERSYEGAVRSTIQALRGVEDAQERVDRLRRDQQSGLTEARARLRVLEAEERLQDALGQRGSGDPFFEVRARVAEQEAIVELADANQALADVQSGVNRELRDAEEALASANRAYADAARATQDARVQQARAAADWATAEEDAARRVVAATREVNEALQVLADADELRRANAVNASGPLLSAPPESFARVGGNVGGSTSAGTGGVGGQASVIQVTNYIELTNTNLSAPQVAEEIDRRTRFSLGNRVR